MPLSAVSTILTWWRTWPSGTKAWKLDRQWSYVQRSKASVPGRCWSSCCAVRSFLLKAIMSSIVIISWKKSAIISSLKTLAMYSPSRKLVVCEGGTLWPAQPSCIRMKVGLMACLGFGIAINFIKHATLLGGIGCGWRAEEDFQELQDCAVPASVQALYRLYDTLLMRSCTVATTWVCCYVR